MWTAASRGRQSGMFFLFSNRLGCGSSMVVSIVASLILFALLRSCAG